MDESGEGGGIQQTPRRNVRRKLVQSTLLPRKPEDDAIESDGDFGRSQGKKRRKQRTPKKMAKPTPKQNGTVAGGDDDDDDHDRTYVSPPVPNLRLEAKLRAEEDSRMSAGKQLHPFFSSLKGSKKNQEAAAAENGSSQDQGKEQIVTIGPIHVFERFQDGYQTVDWKNWTFLEHASATWSSHQHIESDSLKLGLKEFDLNEFPTLSHPVVCLIDDEESEKCATMAEASPVGSLDGAQVVGCEVHEAANLSNHADATEDVSHELQSNDFSGQPRSSLWVDKYQPRSALEVCGNTEAVKLMNEWLCQWREIGFQSSQEFLSSDAEKSQDSDYNCSESDSDSENTDCLKNVLLIVGPVGSGKSAAVYACAKEQGFRIFESNASECRSGTVVKQKFGEALKSSSLSRSLEPLFNSCSDGNGVEDVIEVTPLLHIKNDKANMKPLILFEDVDISFAEDRGFVCAIQEIAKKAKGPVVLTANDKNHGLPDTLERLEICFSLPSTEELFSLLSSVCAAEEVKFNPDSVQRLTISSGGDIRKAIMQLQFWVQSKSKRVRKAKNTGDPDRFDHEAGHVLLPKIISQELVSCSHFDGRDEASMSEDNVQNCPSTEIHIDKLQSFDCLMNTCEIIAQSSDGTMMEDCFKDYVERSQKMQQATDECSRIDFGMEIKTAQKTKLDTSRDTVQESWRKICLRHADLKPYLDSEPVEAPQLLDITHQITNLISEADLTHSRCLNFVAMEPMMNASGDLDTSGLANVLEQMTSIVAHKGFSFFTNQIATTGSVPTSSATMQEDYTLSSGGCWDMKPETHNNVLKCERMVQLSGILESVIPPRSLNGRAFHEYASFIGKISRAGPSNVSGDMERRSRRRRSRESRHYLSMDLSSEDIAFLGTTQYI